MTVLAELLNERKALVTKMGELVGRIESSAIVDADDVDLDGKQIDINDLMFKLEQIIDNWHTLNVSIKDANNVAKVKFEGSTFSLANAIMLRDSMLQYHKRISSIKDSIEGSNRERYLYGRESRKKSDIKQIKLISSSSLHAKLDNIAERVRLLDIEIQKVNWSTEV